VKEREVLKSRKYRRVKVNEWSTGTLIGRYN